MRRIDRMDLEDQVRCAGQQRICTQAGDHETGMRAGEVLDLRWGDVTLDPGREALRIREAKNGTERTVILGPTATPRSRSRVKISR